MKNKKETTKMYLTEFLNYMNASEYWKLSNKQIIKDKGWTTLENNDEDVCTDGAQTIVISESREE